MNANNGMARLHAVRYEQGGFMGLHPLGHASWWAWYVSRCYSREFQVRTRILRKLIVKAVN